jgi:hypothetical protein
LVLHTKYEAANAMGLATAAISNRTTENWYLPIVTYLIMALH